MTKGLHRYYGSHDLHFITCSCYRRRPLLNSAKRRDLFLSILEETRRKYRFVVHGYVVMPEHFHLLITEPEVNDPSVVMKVLKERFSRQINRKRKPAHAGQWMWSSFRSYFYGEKGLVRVNFQEWPSKVPHRPAQKFGDSAA
jgi:REP element-mobilizing transposase RayT